MHSFSDLLKSPEPLKMLTSLENKELGAFAPSVNSWLRGLCTHSAEPVFSTVARLIANFNPNTIQVDILLNVIYYYYS